MKPQLQRILSCLRENLPPGVSWKDMLLKGWLCLAHSRAAYPQFVEELEDIRLKSEPEIGPRPDEWRDWMRYSEHKYPLEVTDATLLLPRHLPGSSAGSR